MKHINVWFEDEQHKYISEIKQVHGGNLHDFILDAVRFYASNKLNVKDERR